MLHDARAGSGLVADPIDAVEYLTCRARLHVWDEVIEAVEVLVALHGVGVQAGLLRRASQVVVAGDVFERVAVKRQRVVQCVERTSHTLWVLIEVLALEVVGAVVGVGLHHVALHLTGDAYTWRLRVASWSRD